MSHAVMIPDPGLRDALRDDVTRLAADIGERNIWRPHALEAAASYLERELAAAGLQIALQEFIADGVTVRNIEGTRRGRSADVVVVGAHYDTVPGCPGADDNASGLAALLAIARASSARASGRTIRFVAFVNEEPPFFQTPQMGSLVYARVARQRGDRIVGMLSLETIGYFSDEKGSQAYPLPAVMKRMYPDRGNFIGFVANLGSRQLLTRVTRAYRASARVPCQSAVLPAAIPGVAWSDHWAFWQQRYKALMVTDTAPFRNPFYHTARDTPDTLDYERLAGVTVGLQSVVASLAGDALGDPPETGY